MKYQLSKRAARPHPTEAGVKIRSWHVLDETLPSLDTAVVAAAELGRGNYRITSPGGHVQLTLSLSSANCKRVLAERTMRVEVARMYHAN